MVSERAAVDVERLTGDETGLVARQERRQRRHLPGPEPLRVEDDTASARSPPSLSICTLVVIGSSRLSIVPPNKSSMAGAHHSTSARRQRGAVVSRS